DPPGRHPLTRRPCTARGGGGILPEDAFRGSGHGTGPRWTTHRRPGRRRGRGGRLPHRDARQPAVEGGPVVAGVLRDATDAASPRAAPGEGTAGVPPGLPAVADGRAVLAVVCRPGAVRPRP